MAFGHALKQTSELLWYRPYSWQRILANQATYEMGSTWAPTLPTYLQIEATNHCDQRCPFCATGNGTLSRPQGMMSFDFFKQIMDDFGKHANHIDLYMQGESFLNKSIYDMIAYAKQWPVIVKIDTNGMVIDPIKTIESGLDEVWFQLGGASQETHGVYRQRGKFEKALNNIRVMVAERKRRNDFRTRIKMGMIIMKHNEDEWEDFVKLARSLEVDGVVEVAGGMRTAEEAIEFLPENPRLRKYDEEALARGELLRASTTACRWPWNSALISWDGRVHPCPKDHFDLYSVGNLKEQSFQEIWNGASMREFRSRLLKEGNFTSECYYCPGYSGTNHWKHHSHEMRDREPDILTGDEERKNKGRAIPYGGLEQTGVVEAGKIAKTPCAQPNSTKKTAPGLVSIEEADTVSAN